MWGSGKQCLSVCLSICWSIVVDLCVGFFFSVSVSFVLFSVSWQVLANALVDDEVMDNTMFAC